MFAIPLFAFTRTIVMYNDSHCYYYSLNLWPIVSFFDKKFTVKKYSARASIKLKRVNVLKIGINFRDCIVCISLFRFRVRVFLSQGPAQ